MAELLHHLAHYFVRQLIQGKQQPDIIFSTWWQLGQCFSHDLGWKSEDFLAAKTDGKNVTVTSPNMGHHLQSYNRHYLKLISLC